MPLQKKRQKADLVMIYKCLHYLNVISEAELDLSQYRGIVIAMNRLDSNRKELETRQNKLPFYILHTARL